LTTFSSLSLIKYKFTNVSKHLAASIFMELNENRLCRNSVTVNGIYKGQFIPVLYTVSFFPSLLHFTPIPYALLPISFHHGRSNVRSTVYMLQCRLVHHNHHIAQTVAQPKNCPWLSSKNVTATSDNVMFTQNGRFLGYATNAFSERHESHVNGPYEVGDHAAACNRNVDSSDVEPTA